MKVYINILILVSFSLVLFGCTGDKKKIEYTIQGSGGMITTSGSISLNNSIDIAYINQFSGSVMIDSAAATQGAMVHENSVLTTGSESEVEIIFVDSSIVRLSSNSRLQISKKGTDNTTLDLQNGTLWARILKPFTDMSFFTLETDDLSAGVRGTSVWLITDSGGTDIGVVDTTSTGGQSLGALIDIVDKAYFGSGNVHLSEEDMLSVRHKKPIEHKKMKLSEQIKKHPFIGLNTIRDIRYMNKIIQDPTSQMGTRGRVNIEMNVTMPTTDEITIYLSDPIIREEIKKQSIQEFTPKEFIRYLDLNEKIEKIIKSDTSEIDKKQAIEEIRKLILVKPVLPIESTGSQIDTKKIPEKIIVPIKTITPSTVSGEKKISKIPCRTTVSGEPCR